MPIRILLVDDHPALVRGLASLFEDERFLVVGTADTSEGLLELARAQRPDIAITDLSMPGDVFEAIAETVRLGTRVVIFTAYADPKLAFRALEAGALGFVLKGRPADDLFEAVRAVEAGQVFVSPELAPRILAALQAHKAGEQPGRGHQLSLREQQIVDGLLRAKTNKEIARELNLSEKTIKHYMTNLMAKLGAKNRLDVVLAVQATPALLPQAPAPTLSEPYKGA
ncbi:MAG TPA: response regulator transcription factor [Devosia sp.]|nr:response regulator transcription factor [Devosia sp.]